METAVFVSLGDLCQQFTILIAFIAYVPQWRSLLKKRSSYHVSLQAWTLWTVSGALALIYAIVQNIAHGMAGALLLSTTANFLCLIITISLIVLFRKSPAPTRHQKSRCTPE